RRRTPGAPSFHLKRQICSPGMIPISNSYIASVISVCASRRTCSVYCRLFYSSVLEKNLRTLLTHISYICCGHFIVYVNSCDLPRTSGSKLNRQYGRSTTGAVISV